MPTPQARKRYAKDTALIDNGPAVHVHATAKRSKKPPARHRPSGRH
ncbi:hypothetical protein ABZ940_35245 [Streptomyces wuyuanensis]